MRKYESGAGKRKNSLNTDSYMTVHTGMAQQGGEQGRVYGVMYRGTPVMATTIDKQRALKVWKKHFGEKRPVYWDGDIQQFVTENKTRKNVLVIPREKLYTSRKTPVIQTGRPYIGVLSSGDYRIFKAPDQPTESSHGKIYRFVIGPFRTVLGAKIMERFGRGNPHIQHVSDAEKFASKGKQWLLDHGFEAAFS